MKKNSICTSIFIVDEQHRNQISNELFCSVSGLTICDTDKFEEHLKSIDGWAHTLVVDHHGIVLGLLNYSQNNKVIPLNYLPDKYQNFEHTSLVYQGLLLVFVNEKIFIYYNGVRIMTKKGKNWYDHLNDMSNTASSYAIEPSVLNRVIKLAFKLSDRGEGALLCVGDAENVLKYVDTMGDLHFSFKDKNILTTDEQGLLTLAAQDGAVIITADGEVSNFMVRFEPPSSIQVTPEANSGTRHNTAKKMSAVTNAIFITVSSDGPISIYARGERVLRMMVKSNGDCGVIECLARFQNYCYAEFVGLHQLCYIMSVTVW